MRRAEHGKAVDFAAVPQFTGDESGFDGFSDAHVVGDEEANGGLPERHEKRDQLIGAGFDGDVGEGPERSGTGAELELQGVPQELCGRVVSWHRRVGLRKRGGSWRHKLQARDQRGDVLLGASEWAEAQQGV